MDIFATIAKLCVIVFFGGVFLGNLVSLMAPKAREQMDSQLYFEKQLWMVVSLLAIAVVMANL